MMVYVLGLLLVALLLLCEPLSTCKTIPVWASNNQVVSYFRAALLSLRYYGPKLTILFRSLLKNVPEDIRYSRRQRLRKRGRRGGVRQRLEKSKSAASDTRSRGCFEYRESCIMLLTETWLHRELCWNWGVLTHSIWQKRVVREKQGGQDLFVHKRGADSTQSERKPATLMWNCYVWVSGRSSYPESSVTSLSALFMYLPVATPRGLRLRWQTVYTNNYSAPQTPRSSSWKTLTTAI